jgi:hypothetical protein
MTRFQILGLALVLAGCEIGPPKPSQTVLDTISVCNSGYSVSLTAALEADVLKVSHGDVSAQGRIEKAIQGQFLSKANVSEERAVDLYQSYVNCVQSERSTAELVAILEQRRTVILQQLQQYGRDDTIPKFNALYSSYLTETQANQRVAAHETGRAIQILLMNTAAEVQISVGGMPPTFYLSKDMGPPIDRMKIVAGGKETKVPAAPPCKAEIVEEAEYVYTLAPSCPNEMELKILEGVESTPSLGTESVVK